MVTIGTKRWGASPFFLCRLSAGATAALQDETLRLRLRRCVLPWTTSTKDTIRDDSLWNVVQDLTFRPYVAFIPFFFLLFSPLLLSFSPLFFLFLLFFIVILLLWMIDGRQRYLRFRKIVWKAKLKIFRLDLPFNLLRANLVMFYFLFYCFFDWFTLFNSFLQFWFYFLMYYSIF